MKAEGTPAAHEPLDDAAAGQKSGEYAQRGDYHRRPDASWDYLPTYLAKLDYVRRYLAALPEGTRVLDAGCGEGVLVEEFAPRLAIEGVDPNYQSAHVRRASLLDLPFDAGTFARVLCLDVLEHLTYDEQPRALVELHRVLASDGELLVSVPNLAHLQSRIHFLITGRLIRTASEVKHPGDRPIAEYLRLFERAGFQVAERRGIFPTVPVLTAWIRRKPADRAWLHRAMTRLLPVPGWAFLNLVRLTKRNLY
jgi:SAM-dependent methyltransferase